MAQNNDVFVKTLCMILNELNRLGLSFECMPEETETKMNPQKEDINHYIFIEVRYISSTSPNVQKKLYITVKSNGNVMVTFDPSCDKKLSTEPQVLSKGSPYADMKRITYGNKSIENFSSDLKNILNTTVYIR
ncbi:MAG: hypothetical protein NC307_13780 [Roseburia sp.]|nr:hypothetical protein [Roseburia sp.]